MKKEKWHEETYKLLLETKASTAEILEGAGVDKQWYHKFKADKYNEPGVNKINRMNVFLKKHAKKVKKSK